MYDALSSPSMNGPGKYVLLILSEFEKNYCKIYNYKFCRRFIPALFGGYSF